jgi:hypothetical protein
VYPLGHLGIGLQIAKPFRRDRPLKPLLLGTLLPDLIDKPLYYGLSWATGREGRALGLISGTRTFGHTGLLTVSVAALAAARRSKALAALALGMATHLLLDAASDLITGPADFSLRVVLWPFMGRRFPVYAYSGLSEHLGRGFEPFFLFAEIVGALILIAERRKSQDSRRRES